ncbi:hypothetical protein TWF694_002576 [Orbilia ellipsospora]|uniref:Mid2 domain-containing protein n=1 Tax=Orbilia ellipsospora TaxID=2528407 RepID=A0AAV9X2D9_9PEZI
MLLKYTLLSCLAFLGTCHFVLNSPPTIGFSDEDEGVYPCGSFDVTSRETVTDFPDGGVAISLTSSHPQTVWYYRAALLNESTANRWISLGSAIAQTGLGGFCSLGVKLPGSVDWEGLDGVLQVVANQPDGWLFQCSAVTFTSGAATDPDSSCKNSSGVTAVYTNAEINASFTSISGSSQTSTSRSTTSSSRPSSRSSTSSSSSTRGPRTTGSSTTAASQTQTTSSTTSSTNPSDPSKDGGNSKSKLSTGAIIGIAVGVGIPVLVVIAYLWYRFKRRPEMPSVPIHNDPTMSQHWGGIGPMNDGPGQLSNR